MAEWAERLRARLGLGTGAAPPAGRLGRAAHGAARVVFAVGRDVVEGELTLRAMGLTYATLLALVPLLAVGFALLKGLGAHNAMEPVLLELFAPLGDAGIELTYRIIGFVANVEVGVLGALGVLFLFYTVFALMERVEQSLNWVWAVETERSVGERIRDYLSVVVVGPALVVLAVVFAASLAAGALAEAGRDFPLLGRAVEWAAALVPFLLVAGAFGFIYRFVPNTEVRVGAALLGGAVAAMLWTVLGWIFAAFVVTSANYAAIYSTFASLILFLIWLHLGWLILLIGAAVAFYYQHPEFIGARRGPVAIGARTRERTALMIGHMVAHAFAAGAPPPTVATLARRIGMPARAVAPILDALVAHGILARSGAALDAMLPARPLEAITLADVVAAVRDDDHPSAVEDSAVARAAERLEAALGDALGGTTLRQLVDESEAGGAIRHDTAAE